MFQTLGLFIPIRPCCRNERQGILTPALWFSLMIKSLNKTCVWLRHNSEIDATVSGDYLESDTNTLIKSQFPTDQEYLSAKS